MKNSAEKERLFTSEVMGGKWKLWGPYLSERQWGTVREDYSASGSAWQSTSHEMARSLAYRWGEDGIGGISDDSQLLCFAPAFWNEKDNILKERFFGLTGSEGNHGEDLKEMYYYIDNTPTHSYMKMLYKYPQSQFPYTLLVSENKRRSKLESEFELEDTAVFDQNLYFDIELEYAKNTEKDILIRITVHNRGDRKAPIHVLAQMWFRNTWSWDFNSYMPTIQLNNSGDIAVANHDKLGTYFLCSESNAEFLFCNNETNVKRLYGVQNTGTYFKDGVNDFIVKGDEKAISPYRKGTKVAIHCKANIEEHSSQVFRFRLVDQAVSNPFVNFDSIFDARIAECDEFFDNLQPEDLPIEERKIQRKALAGMLWSKQYYYYDVKKWLNGDPKQPKPPASRYKGRNAGWMHFNCSDIISMPDKWEYPWFAAWDLAFHCVALVMVDPFFAKKQLKLLTNEWYMHPNGQLPAYEWNFSDVNPPVHAWAAWRIFKLDKNYNYGQGDNAFLEAVFHKLLLNFTWWVNRKDEHNRNIFQGGFLGLDNIGVFDRSAQIPNGGHIEQADGTAWMAMFTLNLMRIALELSERNPVYELMATKFFEHFLYIAGAMANIDNEGIHIWDEEDGFYYDVLHTNDHRQRIKVRSMVGLIPLFAVEVIDKDILKKCPVFAERMNWFLEHRLDLAGLVSRWSDPGKGETALFALLRGQRLKQILKRMLDETEFLSTYGIRALSKSYENHPYELKIDGSGFIVDYQPGESTTSMFGGNSNWRGPIWFPVNFLIVESLQRFYQYFGDDFKVECPTDSGNLLSLNEISNELSNRLLKIFLPNDKGDRPVNGSSVIQNSDPHFKDQILYYEYFHGDTGKGLGASHQTGWTGLIAKLIRNKSE